MSDSRGIQNFGVKESTCVPPMTIFFRVNHPQSTGGQTSPILRQSSNIRSSQSNTSPLPPLSRSKRNSGTYMNTSNWRLRHPSPLVKPACNNLSMEQQKRIPGEESPRPSALIANSVDLSQQAQVIGSYYQPLKQQTHCQARAQSKNEGRYQQPPVHHQQGSAQPPHLSLFQPDFDQKSSLKNGDQNTILINNSNTNNNNKNICVNELLKHHHHNYTAVQRQQPPQQGGEIKKIQILDGQRSRQETPTVAAKKLGMSNGESKEIMNSSSTAIISNSMHLRRGLVDQQQFLQQGSQQPPQQRAKSNGRERGGLRQSLIRNSPVQSKQHQRQSSQIRPRPLTNNMIDLNDLTSFVENEMISKPNSTTAAASAAGLAFPANGLNFEGQITSKSTRRAPNLIGALNSFAFSDMKLFIQTPRTNQNSPKRIIPQQQLESKTPGCGMSKQSSQQSQDSASMSQINFVQSSTHSISSTYQISKTPSILSSSSHSKNMSNANRIRPETQNYQQNPITTRTQGDRRRHSIVKFLGNLDRQDECSSRERVSQTIQLDPTLKNARLFQLLLKSNNEDSFQKAGIDILDLEEFVKCHLKEPENLIVKSELDYAIKYIQRWADDCILKADSVKEEFNRMIAKKIGETATEKAVAILTMYQKTNVNQLDEDSSNVLRLINLLEGEIRVRTEASLFTSQTVQKVQESKEFIFTIEVIGQIEELLIRYFHTPLQREQTSNELLGELMLKIQEQIPGDSSKNKFETEFMSNIKYFVFSMLND